MKQILTLLTALLLALSIQAQELPKPGDIPKEYRKEFRRKLDAVQDNIKQAEREGWDIILDPIEQVPTEVYGVRAAAFDNWGENLLLPNGLRERVKTECKNKVVVKIGDTAGAYGHADLQQGQLPGSNYTTSPLPDLHGHSTHVAGIVAGNTGGLAWELVEAGLLKFKPVKVLGDNGSGSFSWLANAIASERKEDEAYLSNGTAVLYNFSLGGGTSLVASVEAELKKSTEAGVVFICAAGNSGGPVNYPGMSGYTAAIGALQQSLQIASFSSRGPEVTTSMPGVAILSTWKNGGYASLSGTSMASPFSTAAAAIALSKWGHMDQSELTAYLAKVSQDLGEPGKDNLYGWGISYIRAILDTAPGPGEPGPGPDPEPGPKWPKRMITMPLAGGYTMYWKENAPPAKERKAIEPYAMELHPFGEVLSESGRLSLSVPDGQPGVSDLRRLTVTEMVIVAESQEESGKFVQDLEALTVKYFTNRAIYMPAPADFHTALYFTAYFYDLLLTNVWNGPETLRVLEIIGKDEGGNVVKLSGEELKDILKRA